MKTNTTIVVMNVFGWLTILFVGLKLTGYIEWSWWWVLSPMWLPPVAVVGIAFLIWLVIEVYKKFKENN